MPLTVASLVASSRAAARGWPSRLSPSLAAMVAHTRRCSGVSMSVHSGWRRIARATLPSESGGKVASDVISASESDLGRSSDDLGRDLPRSSALGSRSPPISSATSSSTFLRNTSMQLRRCSAPSARAASAPWHGGYLTPMLRQPPTSAR